jgi:hypothetical protein
VTNPPSKRGEDPLASKAREILKESGNCAQTSFVIPQEEFDLDGDQILRALTPFPGIALMAFALEFGRDDLRDLRGYIGSLRSARRFCMRF